MKAFKLALSLVLWGFCFMAFGVESCEERLGFKWDVRVHSENDVYMIEYAIENVSDESLSIDKRYIPLRNPNLIAFVAVPRGEVPASPTGGVRGIIPSGTGLRGERILEPGEVIEERSDLEDFLPWLDELLDQSDVNVFWYVRIDCSAGGYLAVKGRSALQAE